MYSHKHYVLIYICRTSALNITDTYLALPQYAKTKADRDVLFLIDGMSIKEHRQVVVYEPNTGRLCIVLASFPAGGMCLNLQWANLVIFLDRNWNS
jgi:SNF2 family DNA or RNA helicase